MILARTIKWRVECDGCRTAWAYPEGDEPLSDLIEFGWREDDGRHLCPRCVRRAS